MSRAIIPAICIFGLGSILTGGAQARTDAPKASFAPIGEIVSTPYGCMDFCSRQPQECNHPVLAAADIDLTQQTWNTLNHINHQVNDAIEPVLVCPSDGPVRQSR